MSCAVVAHDVPALELVYVVAGDARQDARVVTVPPQMLTCVPGSADMGHCFPGAHCALVVEESVSYRTACASADRMQIRTARNRKIGRIVRISDDFNSCHGSTFPCTARMDLAAANHACFLMEDIHPHVSLSDLKID